ncbi:Protein of unknown function [Gryllus bimaculatus]|nr:Protein of unknown function [Gryllus bimaculatus]
MNLSFVGKTLFHPRFHLAPFSAISPTTEVRYASSRRSKRVAGRVLFSRPEDTSADGPPNERLKGKSGSLSSSASRGGALSGAQRVRLRRRPRDGGSGRGGGGETFTGRLLTRGAALREDRRPPAPRPLCSLGGRRQTSGEERAREEGRAERRDAALPQLHVPHAARAQLRSARRPAAPGANARSQQTA